MTGTRIRPRRLPVDPLAVCRVWGDDLAGAEDAGDCLVAGVGREGHPWRTEYRLPRCRCACAITTVAGVPGGGIVNGISSGPVLNTAAVALTAFGNVLAERAAHLIDILYGRTVSAGFVDRAGTRLTGKLTAAGFEQAMLNSFRSSTTT